MAEGEDEPIVLASAHRHGVGENDMLHALRFALRHVRQSDEMVMFIGPDRSGVLIEGGRHLVGRRVGDRARDAPRSTEVSQG